MKITPTVRAIIGLELRSLIRDVRTVLISIVLPVLLMPVILLISAQMEDRRVERESTRTYTFAVTGAEGAMAGDLLRDHLGSETTQSDGVRLARVEVEDPRAALEADELDFYLEALSAREWQEAAAADSTLRPGLDDFDYTPVLRLVIKSDRTASRNGADELSDRLIDIRSDRRDSVLIAAGFPIPPAEVAVFDTANVASLDEVQGARMGRLLTLFLVMLMVMGGSVLAVDTLAGEKERGTLVTILTTAASRDEIVTAKLLAVVAVALAIAVVQVVNLWVYLGLDLIPVGSSFAVSITPGTAAILLVLYLPIVALTAGILLLTSAYAKSFKEAQLWLTPVLLGMIAPALAPLLPNLQLQSAIIVVPIANVSIAVRDVLVGQPSWLAVGIAWSITAAVAAWVTSLSVRALSDEAVITGDTTRAEFLGGPALFRARVLRLFVLFWAVKVLIDFNLAWDDLRVTILMNVGVVFLAFPLILIRIFKLDPVEALALRAPRPGVWIAVLLGAPAGLLAFTIVAQFVNLFIPVPPEMLETFGQALLPPDIPVWQIIVMMSVIPGIVEELTFRGILIHGLRTRWSPTLIAVGTGLMFGFFHFQLFRIPGTAVLGMILASVVLMTGSVFPAMLWHILNNGLALYLATQDVDLSVESWPVGVAALAALGMSMWLIWKNRTPYPGLTRATRSASEPATTLVSGTR